MNGTAHPANDSMTNVGIGLLIAAFTTLGLLRLAGTVAAWISGLPQPTGGITAALGVLTDPLNPGTPLGAPDLNPIIYWVTIAVLLGVLGTAGWAVWRTTRNLRAATDPRRLAGTATATEITRTASPRSLRKRAKTLRPSLTDPRPADVGYLLGTAKGRAVWATVEDSMLLIGPPARARACTSSSTPSLTPPARSSPPRPARTTSPPPCAPANRLAR